MLQEATVNTLITFEVMCWFFVGEIIGKGGLIGYYIPGAVDYEVHIWCTVLGMGISYLDSRLWSENCEFIAGHLELTVVLVVLGLITCTVYILILLLLLFQ